MIVWLSAVPTLLQFLVVYETENVKATKLPKEKKTIFLRFGLVRKNANFRSSEYPKFCPIPKIENLEISENFLYSIFGSVWNSKSRNRKNDLIQNNFDFTMQFD